jgi:hypothetical protein
MMRLALLFSLLVGVAALSAVEAPSRNGLSEAIPPPGDPRALEYAATYEPQSTTQPTLPLVSISARALPEAFGPNAPLRLTPENRPLVIEILKRRVLMADEEARVYNDLSMVSFEIRAFAVAGATVDDLAFLSRFFNRVDVSAIHEIPDQEIRELFSNHSNGPDAAEVWRDNCESIQHAAIRSFAALAKNIGEGDTAVPLLARALESPNHRTLSVAADGLTLLDTDSAVQALLDRVNVLEKSFPTAWTAQDQADYNVLHRGGEKMSSAAYEYVIPAASTLVEALGLMVNPRGVAEARAALLRWKALYEGNPHAHEILEFMDWDGMWEGLQKVILLKSKSEHATATGTNQDRSLPSTSPKLDAPAPAASATGSFRRYWFSSGIILLLVAAVFAVAALYYRRMAHR